MSRLSLSNPRSTNLSATQCRRAAAAMGEIESKREPMEVAIERERKWAFQTGDWQQKFLLRFFRRTLRRNEQQLTKQFETRQLKTRELMIALTARADQLEQVKSPAGAADLAPTSLKSVPRDPRPLPR